MKRSDQKTLDKVRNFYKQRTPVGATEPGGRAIKNAYTHYLAYVQAAVRSAPPQSSLLEVGCGAGWSSALMAEASFAEMVVGVDLGATFVDGPVNLKLSFVSADALSLPFGPASFGVVTCYQFLEHVAEPGRALDEMIRVLKPGGVVVVTGPNLLSPLVCLWGLICWIPTKPPRYWFVRNPDELRSPFGNTLLEVVFASLRNVALLIKKTWSPTFEFVFRTPDLREPAHADTDACYLLNPVDVRKYLSQRGLRILRYQDGGRLRLGRLGVLKGGTWVVAYKATKTG